MNHTKLTKADDGLGSTASEELIPVLIQCFMVILIGYISGKCGLITSKGSVAMATFMTYFSLPCLIFSSLVMIDFSDVRWAFLASVFLAKTIVFIFVAVVTLILTRPTSSGIAGLYAIFCTQSNDFALGYPLVVSLYKDRPYMVKYIYLLVPIQLLILNPVGFFMMEIDKQQRLRLKLEQRIPSETSEEENSETEITMQNARPVIQPRPTHEIDQNHKSIFWPVIKGIITNPVVVLTALGIIGNFAFNHNPPKTLMLVLDTFASAFAAIALFQLGQNMVGRMSTLSGFKLVEPAILIITKIIVLPLIIRQLVNQLPVGFTSEEKDNFGSFGFLYGTFPTAPSVFVFPIQFDLESGIVATGMVACTILSAPLMLISAMMTTLPISDFKEFRSTLINTVFWVSLFSLFCCIWVLINFLMNQKWKSITHSITMNLTFMQMITGVGGLLWYFIDSDSKALFYSQYITAAIGVFSSRIWTAFLAAMLAFLQWRSLCYVLSYRLLVIILGHVISVLATVALIVGLFLRPPKKYIPDPNFQFGQPEAYVAFAVLAGSLLVTVICLIAQERFRHHNLSHYELLDSEGSFNDDVSSAALLVTSEIEDFPSTIPQPSNRQLISVVPDIEDLSSLIQIVPDKRNCALLCAKSYACPERTRKRCNSEVRQYLMEGCKREEFEYQHELRRHIVLLILLCISMTIGLAVCIWKIIGEDQTGIYIELEFLDAILNFGQGIFTFVVFGLDYKTIARPFRRLYQRLRYGTANFQLPKRDQLKPETIQICQQFVTYHYDSCFNEVNSDKRVGRKVYNSAFRGKELVTWLIAIGLATEREDSEAYGKNLLLGRVIEHVEVPEEFADDTKIYRFLPKQNYISGENIRQSVTADLGMSSEDEIFNKKQFSKSRRRFTRKPAQPVASDSNDIEVLVHLSDA